MSLKTHKYTLIDLNFKIWQKQNHKSVRKGGYYSYNAAEITGQHLKGKKYLYTIKHVKL